jgi:hypothetical protein
MGTAKQVNIFLVHKYFHNFFAGAAPVQARRSAKPRRSSDPSSSDESLDYQDDAEKQFSKAKFIAPQGKRRRVKVRTETSSDEQEYAEEDFSTAVRGSSSNGQYLIPYMFII